MKEIGSIVDASSTLAISTKSIFLEYTSYGDDTAFDMVNMVTGDCRTVMDVIHTNSIVANDDYFYGEPQALAA